MQVLRCLRWDIDIDVWHTLDDLVREVTIAVAHMLQTLVERRNVFVQHRNAFEPLDATSDVTSAHSE